MNPLNTHNNARLARCARHGFRWTLAPLLLLGTSLSTLSLGCSSVPPRSTYAVDLSADSDLALAPATTPKSPAPAAPVPAAPAVPAKTYPDVQSAIQGVQTAATANEAVAAYSAGLALDRDNASLQEAYVRRLVQLNAPQLAEPAARRLVGARPDDSLAWAVIAVAEAKRGNMADALTDIALSARKSPDDPFVQRTAGEMLAWYDNVPTRPELPPGIAADLEAVRHNLGARPTFSGAYAKADSFYKNPPRPDGAAGPAGTAASTANSGAPATQPAPAPTASAPTAAPAPGAGEVPYGPYSDDPYGPVVAPTYVAPGYVTSYVPYAPLETYIAAPYGWPYGYYDPWCGPGFGCGFGASLLFVGGDWGWCGGGGFHRHWDGWRDRGRDRGFGRDGRSFAGRNGVGSRSFAGAGTAGNAASRGVRIGRGGAVQAAARTGRSSAAIGNSVGRSASPSLGVRSRSFASPRFASPSSSSSRFTSPRIGAAAPRFIPSYSPPRGSYNFSRAAAPHYAAPSAGSFRGASIRGGGSFHGGGFHGGGFHGGGVHGGGHSSGGHR